MTIVQLKPSTYSDARSEQAHTAVAEDGWEGLAAFRSGNSAQCTPIEAARYAGHLATVWARLADEAPAERMEIWDAAEELAYDGWGDDADQLLEAARFVASGHLSLRWPLNRTPTHPDAA
jgi:hypothetical protein